MPRATDISMLDLRVAGHGAALVGLEGDDIVIGIGDSERTTRGSFTRARAVAIADAIYEAAEAGEVKTDG